VRERKEVRGGGTAEELKILKSTGLPQLKSNAGAKKISLDSGGKGRVRKEKNT